MPFIQSMKVPTEKKVDFLLDDFVDGFNNVSSPLNLTGKNSPDCLNVIFDLPGVVETRPGLFKFVLEQIPEVIYRVFKYEIYDTTILLLSGTTKLYEVVIGTKNYNDDLIFGGYIDCDLHNDTYVYAEDYRELQTIVEPVRGIQYDQSFYFVDGNKYYEYNGHNIYEIITPIGSETRGVITYDDINFTVTYRPTEGEEADANLGPNVVGDMANCKMILSHKQRICATLDPDNINILYMSDLNNPYYIPTNYYQIPQSNDGDRITGAYSFNDVLVISKRHSVKALYGFDYNDFNAKDVNVLYGAINQDVICQVGNYLFYLAEDAQIYAMFDVRSDVEKMMAKSVSADKISMSKSPLNIDIENLDTAIAITFNDYYILAIQDKIILFKNKAFTIWDNIDPTAMFVYNNMLFFTNASRYLHYMPLFPYTITEVTTAYDQQIDVPLLKGYLNETTDALVYENGVSRLFSKKDNSTISLTVPAVIGNTIVITYTVMPCYNDDGSTYEAYWQSKDFDFRYPRNTKNIREMFITADVFKYFVSEVSVKALIDYYDILTEITIQSQISLWGVVKFGDKLITRNVPITEPISINKRGKIIRFIFSTTEPDSPFRIFRISGEAVVRNN